MSGSIPMAASKRPELRQLTGLRIVVALWVVFFHFGGPFGRLVPELEPLAFLHATGYLAVDVFFVLSGFILSYQYADAFAAHRGRYRRYLVRRLARIWPSQMVMLLAFLLLVVITRVVGLTIEDHDYSLKGAVQDVLLVRGWIVPSQGWNFPAWSLSAEWLAYLLLPLIVAGAVRLLGNPAKLVVLALLVVLEAGAATALPSYNAMPPQSIRVLLGFSAGVVLHALLRDRSACRGAGAAGAIVLVLLVAATPFVPIGGLRAGVGLLLAILLIGCLASADGPVARVLGSRPIEYGGLISFAVYMVHGLVLTVLPLVVDPARLAGTPFVTRLLVALGELGVVVVAAVALHHLVERPLNVRIASLVRSPVVRAPTPR